jgi:type IX secretion system PorP/SprF family membrane protein
MKLILPIYCILLSTLLQAQQLPLFTQYKDYATFLNPAALSTEYITKGHNMSFGGSTRKQWTNVENSPQTQLLRGDNIFQGDAASLVTGLHILKDQTGPTGFTGAYLRLAGIVGNNENGGISAGFNAGLAQFRLNATQIEFADPTDALANRDYKTLYPDISLGVFAYRRINNSRYLDGDHVYAGFSIPQVFGLDLTFRENNKNYSIKRLPHYYATAGYYKRLSDDSNIETSMWVRYVKNVPLQLDFNCRYQINSYISTGLGYSTNKSIHAELALLLGENIGWDSQAIKIGYGYDVPFGTIGPYFGVAHEINVSFSLDNTGR